MTFKTAFSLLLFVILETLRQFLTYYYGSLTNLVLSLVKKTLMKVDRKIDFDSFLNFVVKIRSSYLHGTRLSLLTVVR